MKEYLKPIVLFKGKRYAGKDGDSHDDVIAANSLTPHGQEQRGFSPNTNGGFMTRDQAENWLMNHDPATYRRWRQIAGAGEKIHSGAYAQAIQKGRHMINLSNKKAIIWDMGLFTEQALRLLRDCAEVKYYCPCFDAFPEPFKAKISEGLDGMERIHYFFDHLDAADFVFMPETCCFDIYNHLVKLGIPVAGAGSSELLENNRWHGRKTQQKAGLPTQLTIKIKGVTQFRDFAHYPENYVKDGPVPKSWHVKLDTFRGIEESFHLIDYKDVDATIDSIAYKLGPYKEDIMLICEEGIEGIESGTDSITWEGEAMFPSTVGYEAKGVGYLARVYQKESDMPPAMVAIQNAFDAEFKKNKTRFFYSTECIVDADGVPWLIDPTIRCFDDKTEILTDEGWKTFKNLSKKERVVTLNPETGCVEYHKPTAYQALPYVGNMIGITSPQKAIDLLVTPDHSLWGYQRKGKKKKKTLINTTAGNIPYEFRIPRTGKWEGQNVAFFTLPEYRNVWHSGKGDKTYIEPERSIPMKDWIKFLGIYLAEGSCGGWKKSTINISQYAKKDEVRDLLSNFPYKVYEGPSGFTITSFQLSQYVRQFGLSHEKYVPGFIKGLTPELIGAFLDAFMVGDGHVRKNGGRVFFSNSTRLLDDIQELLLKIGTVGNIYKSQDAAGSLLEINGLTYARNYDTYYLQERIRNIFYNVDKRTSIVKKVPYSGMVYDVTVQNHIIYVRRERKPMWSGNCAGPGTSAMQVELIENYSQVVYGLATGQRVDPIIKAKYGAALAMENANAQKQWAKISFPKDQRQWIKLRMAAKFDGGYYAVPGFDSVCSVVGLGDTMQEAMDLVMERAKMVKGKGLHKPTKELTELAENIQEGKKRGINF